MRCLLLQTFTPKIRIRVDAGAWRSRLHTSRASRATRTCGAAAADPRPVRAPARGSADTQWCFTVAARADRCFVSIVFLVRPLSNHNQPTRPASLMRGERRVMSRLGPSPRLGARATGGRGWPPRNRQALAPYNQSTTHLPSGVRAGGSKPEGVPNGKRMGDTRARLVCLTADRGR